MAVASLSKLTVPLPAGQSSASQGLLMPKLKYRFRVTLQNFGVTAPTTELTKQVMTVTRPEVTFENITLDVYNSKIKYAGKHTWSDITLVVRDDVTGAVSKLVGEQVQKQFDFFEQASAASGIDYKFTAVIEILDGGNGAFEPTVLESFELEGCYLQKVKYADGDYKSSEPMQIDLTLTYDNAIQTNASGNPVGIGQNVGRTVRTMATG
jgi:hypothetical protein